MILCVVLVPKNLQKLSHAGESERAQLEIKFQSWTSHSIWTDYTVDGLVCLLSLSWPQPISMQDSIASLQDALTGFLCNCNILLQRVKPHYSEFIYCPLSAFEMFFSALLWGMTVMLTLSTCLFDFKQMAGSQVHTVRSFKERRIPQDPL